MRNSLISVVVLCLCLPAGAKDKTGLLSAGAGIFYWLPQGSFGEAYDSSIGFGVNVGYGLAESLEFIGEARYGLAKLDEQYWGMDRRDYVVTDPYLTSLLLGARFTFPANSWFEPYAQLGGGYYMWAICKEVGVDSDRDGLIDEYRYDLIADDSTRKFGINARLGGEYPISNDMGLDVAADWNSIFNVDFPRRVDTDGDGSYDDFGTARETINVLTFGVCLSLYF
jgi:opacity protein-like surface antigen